MKDNNYSAVSLLHPFAVKNTRETLVRLGWSLGLDSSQCQCQFPNFGGRTVVMLENILVGNIQSVLGVGTSCFSLLSNT